MPLFSYKARDANGKVIEETIQASSRKDAASLLKADNMQVLTIKNLESSIGIMFGGGKVSLSEKATFCRFTATMLRAGLPVHEAAEVIKQESTNNKLKKILTDISYQTRRGKSLSSILSQHKDVFDPVFLTMIKAGEESGTLDKSFDYLSKQLIASYELSQTIKGSLMYPAVVISAMVGVGIIMLVFVLPQISRVFLNMKIDIPPATKMILDFGIFVDNNLALVLAAIGLSLAFVAVALSMHATRSLIIRFFAKVPVLQKILNQIDIARFSRTLSTLIKSGVPIIEALNVAAESLGQHRFRQQARLFGAGVAKGKSLAEVLTTSGHSFPPIMVQTIKTGEKTGSLEAILQELAEFYESEVRHNLKRFTALLEPILMLLIGVAVGAMVIMIIAPIYSVVGNLQSSISR